MKQNTNPMIKRVIGIGNALTDMLVNLPDDSVLANYQLAKGSMSLVLCHVSSKMMMLCAFSFPSPLNTI